MSDNQHTPGLILTTRIEAKNSTHAHIGVFQNGGKGGVLVVDVEYGDQVAALIAGAPDLLAACEQCVAHCGECNSVGTSIGASCIAIPCRTCTAARSAIAKAKRIAD